MLFHDVKQLVKHRVGQRKNAREERTHRRAAVARVSPSEPPVSRYAGGMQSRIRRVLDKLAQVRKLAPETFGAAGHGFVLAPPLPEAQVAAFERQHGVALPADFRRFLTEAGASGAGPYYGLLPMAEWSSALLGDKQVPDWLARPFLFAPDTPRDEATYERLTTDVAEPFQGAIVNQGCAYYGALVVSGPHAGRVVYLNLDGGTPFFVENPDFLSWYERWLDELSWGHQHFWFGTDMAGSEAELRAVAADPTAPRRVEALGAMFRLPRLEDATGAVIADGLVDGQPRVRKLALALVEKFKVRGCEAAVRRSLDDAEGANRVAALLACKALGVEWQGWARSALHDPDPAVVTRAIRELADAKAVRSEELVPLLDAAEASIVTAVLQALQYHRSAAAVDALLARTRVAKPDPLPALIAHVRAGVMSAAQLEAAFAVVWARWQAEPITLTTAGLCAFLGRHPQALDAVLAGLQHPDGYTRFDMATALGNQLSAKAAELPILRAALEALASDPTMPRRPNMSTAWSVGESAKKALAKILARKE